MRSPEERTRAVGHVTKILGKDVIPGIRNEVLVILSTCFYICSSSETYQSANSFNFQLYPVASSFGRPVYFSLERAAAPYFGIKVTHLELMCVFEFWTMPLKFNHLLHSYSNDGISFSGIRCSHEWLRRERWTKVFVDRETESNKTYLSWDAGPPGCRRIGLFITISLSSIVVEYCTY